MTDKLLSYKDVCDLLQFTRRHLVRLVASGEIKALKLSRRIVRFEMAEIEKYLERHR